MSPASHPWPSPDEPEVFHLLGWAWDVRAARALVAGRPTILVPVLDFADVAPYFPVEPSVVAAADLTRPLLVVPARNDRRLVIAGWDGIHHALRADITELPAWLLTPAEEQRIRLRGG